jgi:hypothetical protein
MIKLRLLLLTGFMFLGKGLFAQGVVPAWASGADEQDWSFGFTFQYVTTDFKIDKKPDWRSPFYDPASGLKLTDSLNSISSKGSPGFALGFIARYRLTDHLEARLTPMFVFADRLLEYEYASTAGNPLLSTKAQPISPTLLEQAVQTTTFDIPLSLKLKSDRLGNFRGYLLGGVKYSKLIAGNKAVASNSLVDKLVKNSSGFTSYELGIGCDFYFEYFKLSPEFKISNSFGNILVPDNNPYARPIDKLFLHTFMFSLYFE